MASTTRSFAPSTRLAPPATTAAAANDVVAVNWRRLISLRSAVMSASLVPPRFYIRGGATAAQGTSRPGMSAST